MNFLAHLYLSGRRDLEIRMTPAGGCTGALGDVLARFFDGEGVMTGDPVERFPLLERELSLLPDAARIVPLFLLYIHTGMYDTRIGVILAYASGSLPLGIWLMAAIIRQIPIRLEQAARIDGAGPFTIARKIVLPLARPGVIVVGTLAFVSGWNAFSIPLILAQSPNIQPYTVALQKYVIVEQNTVNWTLLSAGSLVGLVPVLLVFGFLQRRLLAQGGLGAAVRAR